MRTEVRTTDKVKHGTEAKLLTAVRDRTLPPRRYLTDLSLVRAARVSETNVGPGHMVSSMIAFGVGTLVMLSAGIFLAHAVAAYRAQ